MNLFDGTYKAELLKKDVVYDTDAGQEITGDGRRYGVFCDGLIVTSLKTTVPNLGMPMPEIYSNGVYAAKLVERYTESAAQLQEDSEAHQMRD